jgi:hypothetical protein
MVIAMPSSRPSMRVEGGAVNERLDRRLVAVMFVDQPRAALSADDVARATDAGRRLTITEALDLARSAETASV